MASACGSTIIGSTRRRHDPRTAHWESDYGWTITTLTEETAAWLAQQTGMGDIAVSRKALLQIKIKGGHISTPLHMHYNGDRNRQAVAHSARMPHTIALESVRCLAGDCTISKAIVAVERRIL